MNYVNGTRYSNYYKWDKIKNKEYDYSKFGLLSKLMSSEIINTKNKALKYLLSYFENSLIMVLKYTDELKNFKNIHWKNR